MKKAVSLLLILMMVISINACGASGQDPTGAVDARSDSGAKTETESAQEAAEWDASEEKFFDYDDGQVLLENEIIRLSASSLTNYMSMPLR